MYCHGGIAARVSQKKDKEMEKKELIESLWNIELERIKKMEKALIFVEHVEEHLKTMFKPEDNDKVICKICNKTIDEIYKEHKENEEE